MTTVTSENVRDALGELINRVCFGHERMTVTRRGKPVAAIVPLEDLEILENILELAQDNADLPVLLQRLQSFQETQTGVSWNDIKANNGL